MASLTVKRNLPKASQHAFPPFPSKFRSIDSTSAHISSKNGLMSPPSIPSDPFLSQYIKNRNIASCVNNHQLYFNSLDKERTSRSYEVYQKYLVKPREEDIDQFQKDLYQKGLQDDSQIDQKVYQKKKNYHNDYIPTSPPGGKPIVNDSPVPTKQLLPEKLPAKATPATPKSTKELPDEFMECPIDGLINLISRMLHSLITLNDKSVHLSISNPAKASSTNTNPATPTNSLLTRYHSRTPPSISTHTYLTRLTKFNNFNPATLLTTIYYIDLLSHQYQPYFTLNSWTVHRFLLVATMLAQKAMEDFFYTNDHYAKVGGVAISELNCLELDFLERVEWRCLPRKTMPNGSTSIKHTKDVLDMYYSQLIELMGRNTSFGNVHYVSAKHNSKLSKKAVQDVSNDSIGDGDENHSGSSFDGSDVSDSDGSDDYYDSEDEKITNGILRNKNGESSPNLDNSTVRFDSSSNEEHPTNGASNSQGAHSRTLQKFDPRGYSTDGSSSPHLKRKRPVPHIHHKELS